jgi:hypothetical protein
LLGVEETKEMTNQLVAVSTVLLVASSSLAGQAEEHEIIPDLVGTWIGENRTVSDKKGYRIWGQKKIEITEQRDRRFRGHFSYAEGTKKFFGVIYPDNISFTWVAPDSKGYNQGRILDADRISACYVESGEDATAGCAELFRQK